MRSSSREHRLLRANAKDGLTCGLVASGKVTEVLVVDQSRLSRSGDDLEFLQACALQKVTVRALTGGVIETETVGGFMQAGIMSVVNQAYSRLNSAKVKMGWLVVGLQGITPLVTARTATDTSTGGGAGPRAVGSSARTVGRSHGIRDELSCIRPVKPRRVSQWPQRLG